MFYFPVSAVAILVSIGLFASLLILGWLIHLLKNEKQRALGRVLGIFIPLWFIGLCFAVLPASPQPDPSIPDGTFNWIPFLAHRERDLGIELVANLGLFVPLGLMLAFFWQTYSVGKTVFLALGISCSIELTQLLLNNNRAADITDIITNTAGATVAAVVGWIIVRMVSPMHATPVQDEAASIEAFDGHGVASASRGVGAPALDD